MCKLSHAGHKCAPDLASSELGHTFTFQYSLQQHCEVEICMAALYQGAVAFVYKEDLCFFLQVPKCLQRGSVIIFHYNKNSPDENLGTSTRYRTIANKHIINFLLSFCYSRTCVVKLHHYVVLFAARFDDLIYCGNGCGSMLCKLNLCHSYQQLLSQSPCTIPYNTSLLHHILLLFLHHEHHVQDKGV